jgi:hypothetical protein
MVNFRRSTNDEDLDKSKKRKKRHGHYKKGTYLINHFDNLLTFIFIGVEMLLAQLPNN